MSADNFAVTYSYSVKTKDNELPPATAPESISAIEKSCQSQNQLSVEKAYQASLLRDKTYTRNVSAEFLACADEAGVKLDGSSVEIKQAIANGLRDEKNGQALAKCLDRFPSIAEPLAS